MPEATNNSGGFFGDLLGTALTGYGAYQQYQNYGDAGSNFSSAMQPYIDQARQELTFRPYTVTSGIGNTGIDTSTGQMSYTPSAQQQALSDLGFEGAMGLFGQALAPQDQRVQDVYNQIRATQTPAEERARLATENRMAAQGRLGLQSAQFGGSSPELLAQEQAIAEAQNKASLMALSQAQAEQLQNANIGTTMLNAGYSPYSFLLDQQKQATTTSELAQRPQLAFADLLNQYNIGALTAQGKGIAGQNQTQEDLYSLGGDLLSKYGGDIWNFITGERTDGTTAPITEI